MNTWEIIVILILIFILISMYSAYSQYRDMKKEIDKVESEKKEILKRKGIEEEDFIFDRYINHLIIGKNEKIYLFNSGMDNLIEIEEPFNISLDEKYEMVKTGWTSCKQLQFVVLKIENDEVFELEFHSGLYEKVKAFVEKIENMKYNSTVDKKDSMME